jgi:hypothetical protein
MFASGKTSAASTGGYQISRSLRFNDADSAYLNRTFPSAGNQKTWTWSGWVKRTGPTNPTNAVLPFFGVTNAGNDSGFFVIGALGDVISIQGWNTVNLRTTAVYRDYSAWQHIVVALDTTQATAANRLKLYVNNVQETAFSFNTPPTLNADYPINGNVAHNIFSETGVGSYELGGYLTEVNFIDGQALTPSSFGSTNADTGVWQPKAYSGSYGTNGFYLNFSDNSNTTAATLGKDYSGNGNNWTPKNFSVTAGAGNDSLVDSPTSYGVDTGVGGTVRGNYATLNPLQLDSVTTLANGNLDYSRGTLGGSPGGAFSTIGMTSGKWYAEFTLNTSNFLFGVWGNGTANLPQTGYPTYYWDFGAQTGALSLEKTSGSSSGSGGTAVAGNVYAIAVDIDNATISFYQNNTLAYSVTGMSFTGPLFFVTSVWTNSVITGPSSLNFGQRPFAYTAPSGFKALCTQNLPTPTIGATTATQAGKFFNPVTYTGTGSSLGVTGVGFQPDWVWVKSRSGATDHGLYDAVRGVQKQLESNTDTAETTETTGLTAFGSDGFTTGALAQLNTSSATYVAWNWKANGAGSSNTAGSITSTVSASTTSGFSIVTYTGQVAAGTIGHGLGVAPSWIIVKNRTTSSVGYWTVYSSALGSTSGLFLNTTGAAFSPTDAWNSTSPTSTVFSVGPSSLSTNTNGYNFVAYCFAEIAGYSKFGSYTGNASTDGTFVFTGFRPAYVMIKSSSAATDWIVYDAVRNTYNVTDLNLRPNANYAESSQAANYIDLLSNGFKLRGDGSGSTNASGATYIYMAFASAPLKYSLAR